MDENGRILIPAEQRRALGLRPGDRVAIQVKDGEALIFSQDQGIRKAQELVRKYVPEGVSLVDELIAERRAEAERE
jgi:AbrB family looped-hinge helix DNA binding protein